MINKIKYILCFLMFTSLVHASELNIIQKAMTDELGRGMDELVYQDTLSPFFISYTLADVDVFFASSTLGGITHKTTHKNRTWFARVMVGDYQINDENYEDYNSNMDYEYDIIDLPVDDDYWGIRRSLWSMTNSIFKKAAEGYSNKVKALKQNDLTKDDLEMHDFAEAPVIEQNEKGSNVRIDKNLWLNRINRLSDHFKNHPEIYKSNIILDAYKAQIYFVNSEGSSTSVQKNIVSLQVLANMLNEDGQVVSDHITYHWIKQDDLISEENLLSDIDAMVENLKARSQAPNLEENYYGPVLILDQAVAEVFEQTLFHGASKLIATREPLVNSPQMKMYYSNYTNSTEDKLGKKIASENLWVYDFSKLPAYDNTSLIGAFNFDAEGVTPPNKLALIEGGKLKNILNNRTPTRKLNSSNGHNRYVITATGVSRQIAPGIISAEYKNGISQNGLKAKLLKAAREEGLEYGIMLKPISKRNAYAPINFYRVWVKDGREELINSVYIKNFPKNTLKRIASASNSRIAYNGFYGSSKSNLNGRRVETRGVPVSFIVPDGVLLEEGELVNIRKPVSASIPTVKSPVELLNKE